MPQIAPNDLFNCRKTTRKGKPTLWASTIKQKGKTNQQPGGRCSAQAHIERQVRHKATAATYTTFMKNTQRRNIELQVQHKAQQQHIHGVTHCQRMNYNQLSQLRWSYSDQQINVCITSWSRSTETTIWNQISNTQWKSIRNTQWKAKETILKKNQINPKQRQNCTCTTNGNKSWTTKSWRLLIEKKYLKRNGNDYLKTKQRSRTKSISKNPRTTTSNV